MIKKYRGVSHFNGISHTDIKPKETYRKKDSLQLSEQGMASRGWPTALIGSAMALSLVVATSARADFPVRPVNSSTLSISAKVSGVRDTCAWFCSCSLR